MIDLMTGKRLDQLSNKEAGGDEMENVFCEQFE